MSFSAVGSPGASTSSSFSITPHAVGNFILLGVLAGFPSGSSASYATALSASNITWSVLVAHHAFTGSTGQQTIFIGQVTSTSAATTTITFNSGTPGTRTAWLEFSSTQGYSAVTLDTSGTVDTASSGSFPSLTTGHGSGELYWAYLWDTGTGSAGSTTGVTYSIDPNGNPMAYDTSVSGTLHPNIGDTSDGTSGTAVLLYEAVTSHAGAAALNGEGTMSATGAFAGNAALSGEGTLGGDGAVATPGNASLSGQGTIGATAQVIVPGAGTAGLFGEGTLGDSRTIAWPGNASLSGQGTISAQETGLQLQDASLSGEGALGFSVSFGIQAALSGAGTLSIPQVSGGLVNGIGGGTTPLALPGSSQVAVAPPGSSAWRWLGTLGQVTALTYSFVCPGGADKMTCTLMVPASYRTQLFSPGWQVKITRGGHQAWYGKLDEPQPSPQGWTLTAVGAGNLGQNFTAYYAPGDTWPTGVADDILNRAISRGLPWTNPGMSASPYYSQFWFGQQFDSGSETVTAFLNLICTRGALTWYVSSQPGGFYGGNNLSVFPLPTVPNRLLVCTTPAARTLGGYVNYLIIRYESSADAAGTSAATYAYTSASNPASIAAHGQLEDYLDLSNASVLSAAQAQAVGANILSIYEAASYKGPFQASYGQLLNTGGAAIDPGTDQSGTRVRLVLADSGYGGEVVPGPIEFTVGSYSWDDYKQVATIGPYQELDQSLSGLSQMITTTMKPIAAAG